MKVWICVGHLLALEHRLRIMIQPINLRPTREYQDYMSIIAYPSFRLVNQAVAVVNIGT